MITLLLFFLYPMPNMITERGWGLESAKSDLRNL